LQCPSKHLSPGSGQSVGGVSGGADARAVRGEIPVSFVRRNGGRHPDLRGAGILRGVSEERRSWPVRTPFAEVSSSASGRTGDSRVSSGSRRRGTSSCARKSVRARTRVEKARRVDTSFARSRGPCWSPPHPSSNSGASLCARAVARPFRHRGRANLRKQEEPTPGSTGRTQRGSPRVTARGNPRKRDASEEEGGRGLRPREEARARVLVRTSLAVAEVGRRHLASNKLPRSAPKRVAAEVNGGLAGAHIGRKLGGASCEEFVERRAAPE
jgi:hypothetical protein